MRKKYKRVSLSEIIPYENNPRRNDEAVVTVAKSIEQCGYISPIVVDENMEILAGHTRAKALQFLGQDEAEIVVVSGLTDEQKRKFRLLDNKTGELAEWDFDLLEEELEGLDFDDFDLDWGIDDNIFGGESYSPPSDDPELTYRYTRFWENAEKRIYDGVGRFDIPQIVGTPEIEEVGEFIGFNYALSEKNPWDKAVHFFVDDYQFQRLWTNPDQYLDRMREFQYVFTPDFSVYANFPFALQVWNHFRKHWIGAYFQENGIRVIPTITWSFPESFEYCFDGEPTESVVAISSVGCMNSKEGRKVLLDGYAEMIKRLNPTVVLLNGQLPEELKDEKIIVQIKSFQDKRWHESREEEGADYIEEFMGA